MATFKGKKRGQAVIFHGHVDRWSPTLEGWVVLPEASSPLRVVVLVDGKIVSKTVADLPRPDVFEAGFATDRCGFVVELGEIVTDTKSHDVALVDEKTGLELFRSSSPVYFTVRGPINHPSSVGKSSIRSITGSENAFFSSVSASGRMAILSTFRQSGAREYLTKQLIVGLTSAGYPCLVIDTSPDCALSIGNAESELVVHRNNVAYDFGSWYCGLDYIRDRSVVRSLILVNDSCYGPFDDLGPLLRRMENHSSDVVSLTDGWFGGYHLQSNFLMLKSRAIKAAALQHFFSSYEFPVLKADIVQQGEIGLSSHLLKSDLELSAMFSYQETVARFMRDREIADQDLDPRSHFPFNSIGHSWVPIEQLSQRALKDAVASGTPLNLTHAFWDLLIDMGMPFVKKDLLLKNPLGVPGLDQVGPLIKRKFGFSDFREINRDIQSRGRVPIELSI